MLTCRDEHTLLVSSRALEAWRPLSGDMSSYSVESFEGMAHGATPAAPGDSLEYWSVDCQHDRNAAAFSSPTPAKTDRRRQFVQ
jgi:hypothetical protein